MQKSRMKLRSAILLTVCVLVFAISFGQAFAAEKTDPNKVTVQSIVVKSKAVPGETMEAKVILPPGYDKGKKYPVLYLLHGADDRPIDWIEQAGLIDIYEKLFSEGKIGSFIIVCPASGNNNVSFYINWLGDKTRHYEDYMINELIPLVEKNYSVIGIAEARGIGGFSMGGYGAMTLSLKHLEMFNTISSFSGGLSPFNLVEVAPLDEELLSKVFGTDTIALKSMSPANMVEKVVNDNPDEFDKKHYFISIGDNDWLMSSYYTLVFKMRALNANFVTKIVANAGHDWGTVNQQLPDALVFHWNEFAKAVKN